MSLEAKSIQIEEIALGRVLHVTVSGKLEEEDYERFVPEVERRIRQHGKLRLLVELVDFEGWEATALWEDLKFDWRHFSDFERLAIVGEKRWQEGMASFCKPFTTAEIEYFDSSEMDQAKRWIAEGIRF